MTKGAAGNIGLLTSKSSLQVSINIKVIRSLQDRTVARVKGLRVNLNPIPTISRLILRTVSSDLYELDSSCSVDMKA